MIEIKNFPIESSSAGVWFSIETLMEAFKPLITDKPDFPYRKETILVSLCVFRFSDSHARLNSRTFKLNPPLQSLVFSLDCNGRK